MPVIAKLNNLRIAPRKVRMAADLIRGKTVKEAEIILNFAIKRAALPVLKLLKSAVANARNNFQLDEANLYIKKILVNEGAKLKRWMPRARGQASEIQKKTSHIILILDEISKRAKKIKEAEEIKKGIKLAKAAKTEKPKFEPIIGKPRPKIEKGLKRIFRRKAF